WTTPEQGEVVRESVTRYQQALDAAGRGRITTELAPLSEAGDGVYYTAEPEHQQFLAKNPYGYCNHGFNGVACSLEPAAQDDLPSQESVLRAESAGPGPSEGGGGQVSGPGAK